MERTNLVCRHGLQYHKKRLTKITHNGFDYTFAYDGFGNRKSVSIAGKAAVSHDYTYDAQGQLPVNMTRIRSCISAISTMPAAT